MCATGRGLTRTAVTAGRAAGIMEAPIKDDETKAIMSFDNGLQRTGKFCCSAWLRLK